MAFQKVEFEFPEPEDKTLDIEDTSAVEIDVSGKKTKEDFAETKEPEVEVESEKDTPDDDFEVEVVDDTPKADRNRKPSEPPTDITDEELEDYSKSVQKRINNLTRKLREAERGQESAYEYAKRTAAENEQLKTKSSNLDRSYLMEAENRLKSQKQPAMSALKSAHEVQDFDKVAKAIGFSSGTLQDARSEISARQHLKFKGRGAKEAKTQEFVKMKMEAIAAARAGDQARARRLHQEFYREWMAHKKEDRSEDPEDRLNIRMQTITQRVRVQQDPLGRAAERYIPRHLRKGLRDRTLLAGYPS